MNNNMLISAAMLSAFWEKERKDTLDLLTPFVKYSIAMTTRQGNVINIQNLTTYFQNEFGYDTIPLHVMNLILKRLSPAILTKQNNQFRLEVSLDEDIETFKTRRATFLEHRNKVAGALKDYLNENLSIFRCRYNEEDALRVLIAFFIKNGLYLKDSNSASQILSAANDKVMYCIADFILTEEKNKSEIFFYIEEMIKGFFVSTAISLQPENLSITKSKFRGLKCYIDSNILIRALGMLLEYEETSSKELLVMLKEKGASLYCFEHVVSEIKEIINAYKRSLQTPSQRYGHLTLEGWDAKEYKVGDVEIALSLLRSRIKALGVEIVEGYDETDTLNLSYSENDLFSYLDDKMNYTRIHAIDVDVKSITSVMILRKGRVSSEIEKCKHIFVTSNSTLANVVKNFFVERLDYGSDDMIFPAISDIDLSAIVWLKTYSSHKDFPQKKLIEQSAIALMPTHSMMQTFYDIIEKLRGEGKITEEEAAVIRVDSFCRKSLAKTAIGDINAIDENTVYSIRDELKKHYVDSDNAEKELLLQRYNDERNRNMQTRTDAETFIEQCGDKCYNIVRCLLRVFAVILFSAILLMGIIATIKAYNSDENPILSFILLLFSIVGIFDLVCPKMHFVFRLIDHVSKKVSNLFMRKKRAEYSEFIK